MPQVNPYITFNGTCEAAFNFYKSVFGGEFPYIGKFKDMPPAEGKTMPAAICRAGSVPDKLFFSGIGRSRSVSS